MTYWLIIFAIFQTVYGFGAALSNSAAYVIQNSPHRDQILNDLFSSSANDVSVVRFVMGGSDFQAVPPYTYDDIAADQTDFNMDSFTINKDYDFVLPVMKSIKAINPSIKVVGSPWSAPAWMKLSQTLYGGEMNTESEYFEAYANYFVRFIQAYAAEGVTIDAITVQNEPMYETSGYPSMLLEWYQESNFIGYHLGPAFQRNNINTEIWIFDHNWDMTWYPLAILNEPIAYPYVSASAFHCYGGNPDAIQEVHDAYPDKDLQFTECSGGEWSPDFASNLWWNFQNLFAGQLRHWSRSTMFWNLALDQNHGPTVDVDGCSDCRGVVTVDTDAGSYVLNVEYYNLGQFTRWVKPGAVRVGSTEPDASRDWSNVAFRDDSQGTTVVVVGNGWQDGWKTVSIKVGDQYFNYNGDVRTAELLTFVIKDSC